MRWSFKWWQLTHLIGQIPKPLFVTTFNHIAFLIIKIYISDLKVQKYFNTPVIQPLLYGARHACM